MCLATSNNLLLVLQDGTKLFFPTNSRSSGLPKNKVKTLFPHSPSPFPCNFCKHNNNGIFTASQFYIQLSLLYTALSNAYSEIGPEVTLRPLATSCAKDYKGHSLMQTSITEPPNIKAINNNNNWLCYIRNRIILHSVANNYALQHQRTLSKMN